MSKGIDQTEASILFEGTLFRAHSNELPATLNLIEGIFALYQLDSFRILRKKIFTNDPKTETVIAAVKIGAKSICFESRPENEKILKKTDVNFVFSPELMNSGETSQNSNKPRYLNDRPIRAELRNAQGELIAEGKSLSSKNRIYHAEFVLLKNLFLKGITRIPENSTFFSTLKPCKMCAALIWDYAQNIRKTEVIYKNFDSGPYGRNTVLDPETHERKRACMNHPELLTIDIQKQTDRC